jgi:hypothetical protein
MLTHISKTADELVERVAATKMMMDDLGEYWALILCEEYLDAHRAGRPSCGLFEDVASASEFWTTCALDVELRLMAGAILMEMRCRDLRPVALERMLIEIWNRLPAERRAAFIEKVVA